MGTLILASKSPRRIELMGWIAPDFQVIPSDFDESAVFERDPEALALALARGKARTVWEEKAGPGDIVVGCDTVVALGDKVFGKPSSPEDAREMLTALSGQEHRVITGVQVIHPAGEIGFACETKVRFFLLSAAEIDAYLQTGEPYDKAGAYGIQGRGGLFVASISGDYNNVVGLPLARLFRVLRQIDPQKFT